MQKAAELNPLNSGLRVQWAVFLARANQPQQAAKLYKATSERLPDEGANWNSWMASSLYLGAGDPAAVLGLAPAVISDETRECWKRVVEAMASMEEKVRRAGAEKVRKCVADGSLGWAGAIRPLVALDDVKAAFDMAERNIQPKDYSFSNAVVLFTTGTDAMRDDDRFIKLVTRLGLWKYWLDTGKRPDICDTEKSAFCTALAAAQAGR